LKQRSNSDPSQISWEVLKFPDTEEEKGEETMKKNACLMRLTVEVECKSSKEILKFHGIGSDSKAATRAAARANEHLR